MPSTGALLCLASAAAFGAMGDLRQARLRRGRDRRHAAGHPLRARRRAVLAARGLRRAAPRELRALPRRDVGIALALGAVGYGAQAGGYFAALERLDASLLSLLVYTFPVIVTVAAIALGRERGEPPHGRRAGARLDRARPRAGRAPPRARSTRSARRSGSAAAVVYSAYILTSEGVAARVGPLALSTLVCTGAATTLTLGGLAGGDLRPGRRERGGLRLAGRPRRRLDGRRDRPVLRRAAARGPDGRVDPVDARAGGHRRAGVRSCSASRSARRSSPAARSSCSAVLAVRAPGRVRPRRLPEGRQQMPTRRRPLTGKVALVAGATRGAGRGTAVALGEAGATVYCTGRTHPRAALGVRPAGDDRGDRRARRRRRRRRDRGRGRPPRAGAGRGARRSASTPSRAASTCWSTTSGAASSCSSGTRRSGSTTSTTGLRMLRLAIDTHLITSHFALPLLIRRAGRPRRRDDRRHARVQRRRTTGSRPSTTWPRRRSSGSRSRRARSSRRTAAPPWR